MKIGNWELRKPWVRYVEVELEERFYNEIRKSIGEDIAKEIEAEELAHHNLQHPFWKTIDNQTPIEQMAAYLNGIKAAATIARGRK
jgi:hypothetical protein